MASGVFSFGNDIVSALTLKILDNLYLYLSEKARSIFKNVSILVCYLIQAILIRE